jgi:hypothetical protein
MGASFPRNKDPVLIRASQTSAMVILQHPEQSYHPQKNA